MLQNLLPTSFVIGASRIIYTVKLVLNGHSKLDKTKVLMANGSLIKVKSIAECSPSTILLTCIKR